MMMNSLYSRSAFQSIFTLAFKNKKIEKNYLDANFLKMKIFNFFYSFLAVLSSASFLLYIFASTKFSLLKIDSIILFFINVVLILFFAVCLAFTYFTKQSKRQYYIAASIYALSSISFLSFSIYALNTEKIEVFYVFIIYLIEIVIKLAIIIFLNALDGINVLLVTIVIIVLNNSLIGILRIMEDKMNYLYFPQLACLICLSLVAYMTSLRTRVLHLQSYKLFENKLRHEKILENTNVGYLCVRDNVIEKFNNYFSEKYISYKTKKKISENLGTNIKQEKEGNKTEIKAEDFIEIQITERSNKYLNTDCAENKEKNFEADWNSSENYYYNNLVGGVMQRYAENNLIAPNLSELDLYKCNTQMILNEIFADVKLYNKSLEKIKANRGGILPGFEAIKFLKAEYSQMQNICMGEFISIGCKNLNNEQIDKKNKISNNNDYNVEILFHYCSCSETSDQSEYYELIFKEDMRNMPNFKNIKEGNKIKENKEKYNNFSSDNNIPLSISMAQAKFKNRNSNLPKFGPSIEIEDIQEVPYENSKEKGLSSSYSKLESSMDFKDYKKEKLPNADYKKIQRNENLLSQDFDLDNDLVFPRSDFKENKNRNSNEFVNFKNKNELKKNLTKAYTNKTSNKNVFNKENFNVILKYINIIEEILKINQSILLTAQTVSNTFSVNPSSPSIRSYRNANEKSSSLFLKNKLSNSLLRKSSQTFNSSNINLNYNNNYSSSSNNLFLKFEKVSDLIKSIYIFLGLINLFFEDLNFLEKLNLNKSSDFKLLLQAETVISQKEVYLYEIIRFFKDYAEGLLRLEKNNQLKIIYQEEFNSESFKLVCNEIEIKQLYINILFILINLKKTGLIKFNLKKENEGILRLAFTEIPKEINEILLVGSCSYYETTKMSFFIVKNICKQSEIKIAFKERKMRNVGLLTFYIPIKNASADIDSINVINTVDNDNKNKPKQKFNDKNKLLQRSYLDYIKNTEKEDFESEPSSKLSFSPNKKTRETEEGKNSMQMKKYSRPKENIKNNPNIDKRRVKSNFNTSDNEKEKSICKIKLKKKMKNSDSSFTDDNFGDFKINENEKKNDSNSSFIASSIEDEEQQEQKNKNIKKNSSRNKKLKALNINTCSTNQPSARSKIFNLLSSINDSKRNYPVSKSVAYKPGKNLIKFILEDNNSNHKIFSNSRSQPKNNKNKDISNYSNNPNNYSKKVNESSVYYNKNQVQNFNEEDIAFKNVIAKKNTSLNIIIIDENITQRKKAVNKINKISMKNNIPLNIFEGKDGIECLFAVYRILTSQANVSFIISGEKLDFLCGTEAAEILNKIFLRKKLEIIPYYLTFSSDKETSQVKVNTECVNKIISYPIKTNFIKSLLIENNQER